MKSKLILGTVQFGIKYGINNSAGKPTFRKVVDILNTAYVKGIRMLDTAEAYGDSQNRIGQYHNQNSKKFKIITKFSPARKDLPKNIFDRVNKNLKTLRVEFLYCYMFHSFNDFKKYFPEMKNDLIRLKKESKIKKIGVSLHSNKEIEDVLLNNYIDLIQLPYNLFDNNNQRKEILKKSKLLGIEIHTRSVFLQGLFFKDSKNLSGNLKDLKNELDQLKTFVPKDKMNALALNYAYSNKNIDGIIIGVDNSDQLLSNIECIEKNNFSKLISKVDQINISNNLLLNPVNWKK